MADHIAVMNLGVLQQFGIAARDLQPPCEPVRRRLRRVDADQLPACHPRADCGARGRRGTGSRSAIRPEYLRIVAADSPDATLGAKVNLVEPLGREGHRPPVAARATMCA